MGQSTISHASGKTARLVPVVAFSPFLITEPPALDLVNTRLFLNDMWFDLLDDSQARSEWLIGEAPRLGLLSADVSANGELAKRLKSVRQHAGVAIESARHGKRPPSKTLAGLNAILRAAPQTQEAHWKDGSVVTTRHRTGVRVDRVAAEFAAATVELLADPSSILKVRQCDAPTCVMLFLARNPRRRWCVPSVCGNRDRVARYYRVHKDDRPAGTTTQTEGRRRTSKKN